MGVRIAAAICWFDEPTEFLERAVRSLAGNADVVIAVDGAWEGFVISAGPSRGSDAIRETAADIGLEAHVYDYDGYWESQVAKRDWMMRQAATLADWILVLDGDEFLQLRGDVRTRLAAAPPAAAAGVVTLVAMNRPWPFNHLAPMAFRQPRLFRAGVELPGPAHNDYARYGVSVDDLPTVDVADHVTIWHDNQARPADRRKAAQSYRRVRRRDRLEAPA